MKHVETKRSKVKIDLYTLNHDIQNLSVLNQQCYGTLLLWIHIAIVLIGIVIVGLFCYQLVLQTPTKLMFIASLCLISIYVGFLRYYYNRPIAVDRLNEMKDNLSQDVIDLLLTSHIPIRAVDISLVLSVLKEEKEQIETTIDIERYKTQFLNDPNK